MLRSNASVHTTLGLQDAPGIIQEKHMHHHQRVAVLIIILLCCAAAAPAADVRAQDERCFEQTGQCIRGRFRQYWEQNGALPVFGFPIAPAREERNRDTGRVFLTQWFERNRFELHPENQPPYDVLLGRLGDDRLLQLDRVWQREGREAGPQSGCVWFEQTGHNVCDQGSGLGFRSYWQTHGLRDPKLDRFGQSLALFGQPLTAPRMETNTSGDRVLTQWFERARFEWHPNQRDEFKVLLGLLGNEVLVKPFECAERDGGQECRSAEGVTIRVPEQEEHDRVEVRKLPIKTLDQLGAGDDEFEAERVVVNFTVLDAHTGEEITDFAPPLEIEVAYTAEDVKAAGNEDLVLGFFPDDGKEWIPFDEEKHDFRLRGNAERGVGIVTLSEFVDPHIAWGHR